MSHEICCPQCGSKDIQVTTETHTSSSGGGYSGGKGCLGFVLFGPLGLLCGSCGQKQQTTVSTTTSMVCTKCGKQFKNPEDLKTQIEALEKNAGTVITVSLIVGSIVAILLFAMLCEADAGIAFLMAFLMFSASLIAGFISRSISLSGKENLENQLSDLIAAMEKFNKVNNERCENDR